MGASCLRRGPGFARQTGAVADADAAAGAEGEPAALSRRALLFGGAALGAVALGAGAFTGYRWAGRASPDPVDALVTRWDTDPWSLGSYSALLVGVSPAARRVLGDAVLGGRITLAGEYNDHGHPATTNGAFTSGRRAARRLVRAAEPTSVIVVGAGIAGASAAAALRREGVEVTVIEARDRVGGRIHASEAWGVPVELGAAWVHGVRGNPMVPLARNAGLGLVPTDYADAIVRDTTTGRESPEAVRRWERLDELLSRLSNGGPGARVSVQEWLIREGWTTDRVDAWAAQVEIAQEYGLDADRLSARAVSEGRAVRGGDDMVVGGYAGVVEWLLGDTAVWISTPAQAVESDGSRVRVRLASGQSAEADGVVVAVPLAVLSSRGLAVEPMTEAVREAIASLTTGSLEKVILRYDEPWWGQEQVIGVVGGGAPGAPAGSAASLRWTEFYNLTDVVGLPVLVGLSGGGAAASRPRSDEACVAEAVAALDAAFARR